MSPPRDALRAANDPLGHKLDARSDPAEPRKEGLTRLARRHPELVLTPASVVALVAVWWAASAAGLVSSIILPGPGAVLRALLGLLAEDWYIADIGVTAFETLAGLAMASVLGIVAAVALSFLPTTRRIAYPYIVLFQVIPSVAIAPVFIVWLGFGTSSKIAIAFFTSFFPIVVHTLAGIDRTPANSRRLMTSLAASRGQTLFMLTFPSALPYVFAGLKTGATLALVGAIVGEYILAQAGLGKRLIEFSFALKPDLVWATILVVSALGLTLYAVLVIMQTRFVWWHERY